MVFNANEIESVMNWQWIYVFVYLIVRFQSTPLRWKQLWTIFQFVF